MGISWSCIVDRLESDKQQDKMMKFLSKIITPQIGFEGENQGERFVKLFLDLYRIELFKDGLDLVLTKLQQKHLHFEVRIIKGWDTNVGCFLTEPFNRDKNFLKIILRSLNYNVLAHEMAHALEFESGINLGEEFRKCIGYDMKNREPQIITLKSEKQRLMVDALKSYKPEQFLSELFARYFELLSVSRNVIAHGDFATADVMEFFVNTTNFIEKIFNQKIRPKIDPQIAAATIEIAKQVRLSKPQQKFQDRIESKKWSGHTKSNVMWVNAWNKNQIEEKKS